MTLFPTPDPDASAVRLAHLIRTEKPFFFVRIGDGAVELILGKKGRTCDGETYHPALASEMAHAIQQLKAVDERVIWGDWRTAIAGSQPKLVAEWELMVRPEMREALDYEALLLMRESTALLDFYRAVKEDTRRKLYVGAHFMRGAPFLLNAEFLPLTMDGGVFQDRSLIEQFLREYKPEVILFGAGMGGLIPIVKYWYEYHRTLTCIHLGSALDPLYSHKPTRSRQLSTADARDFLKELL